MPNDGIVHVIDDDEAMRDLLAFLFKTAKVAVVTYEHAGAFLQRLSDLTDGCVVTDVRMPGMSGLDLLKRLRELRNPIPVIVITGHGDVPLAVEAMKYGASDFLEKPFDDELLLSASAFRTVRQGCRSGTISGACRHRGAAWSTQCSREAGARRPDSRARQQDDRLRSRY